MPNPARKPRKRARLKPSQEAFIKNFTDPNSPTFLNGSKSYSASHPKAKEASARVGACNTLTNDNVKSAVRERLSLADLQDELGYIMSRARAADDLARHESVVMSLSKLSGYLVDRQEVKDVTPKQKEDVRRLVSSRLSGLIDAKPDETEV